MRPSVFLKIAAPVGEPREKSLAFLTKHLRDGGAIATPTPNLLLTVPDAWKDANDCSTLAHGSSHEGRHRMLAIQAVFGDAPVDVQIVLQCDTGRNIRNREWTPAMQRSLEKGVVGEETNRLVPNPIVGWE